MLKPFYNERTVVVDGEELRLVINFRAIDATEQLIGCGYDKILDDIQDQNVPLGLQGKVLWGLLREHHSGLSLDQTATLLFGPPSVAIGMAMIELFNAAFPAAEKAKGKNPRKPRGVSKPS
jgi:hypothetical protein